MRLGAELTFAAALVCAGLLGWALQRGSTCMVAAVEALTIRRRPQQVLTLFELVVWIGAAVLVLRAAGVPMTLSIGHSVGAALLAGALLLGVGARVNGACLLGTVARLGSGQWAYAATPLGYWAGSGLAAVGPAMPMPEAPGRVVPLFQLPAAAAALLVLVALVSAGWRWRLAAAEARSAGEDRRSTYRAALLSSGGTALVALGFVTLAVLAGAWSYSDLLADLARGFVAGMAAMLNEGWAARASLAVALGAGAMWAGARAGLWRPERPRAVQIARCAAGGALMGLGGAWVPGGNDQLLLLALPMGWPHALVALLVMALGIVATGGAARLLVRPRVS